MASFLFFLLLQLCNAQYFFYEYGDPNMLSPELIRRAFLRLQEVLDHFIPGGHNLRTPEGRTYSTSLHDSNTNTYVDCELFIHLRSNCPFLTPPKQNEAFARNNRVHDGYGLMIQNLPADIAQRGPSHLSVVYASNTAFLGIYMGRRGYQYQGNGGHGGHGSINIPYELKQSGICTPFRNILISGPKNAPHSTLFSGKQLAVGFVVLKLEQTCDLTLYHKGIQLWNSKTKYQSKDCTLRMQEDGNLVLYSKWDTRALWSVGINCMPTKYCIALSIFKVLADCTLSIYRIGAEQPTWVDYRHQC